MCFLGPAGKEEARHISFHSAELEFEERKAALFFSQVMEIP